MGILFLLAQIDQVVEGLVPSPAVDVEVGVKREDFAGLKFLGESDEAGIGEINASVLIFSQEGFDDGCVFGELKWDLEDPGGDVVKHRCSGAAKVSQKVATLRENCFTGYQRHSNPLNGFYAMTVVAFRAVEQGDDNTGVEQDRLHLPNSWRCFLLEPRSETPERNLPSPMTPRLFRRR